MTGIKKRSMVIAGHSTSVSLEQEFWDELKRIADERKISLAALVREVDTSRPRTNLSSALRVYVLNKIRNP